MTPHLFSPVIGFTYPSKKSITWILLEWMAPMFYWNLKLHHPWLQSCKSCFVINGITLIKCENVFVISLHTLKMSVTCWVDGKHFELSLLIIVHVLVCYHLSLVLKTRSCVVLHALWPLNCFQVVSYFGGLKESTTTPCCKLATRKRRI